MTKTAKEILDAYAEYYYLKTLNKFDEEDMWIEFRECLSLNQAIKELEAIMQGVIGEDDEPRNTLEHSRRNFMRTEQRQALHTALYGEQSNND